MPHYLLKRMNKIKVIIAALFIFSFINVFSQVKFEKILGGTGYDYGYSVIQTFDKGYVVAGSTTSFGAGETDAYIIKTDSMGVPLWQRTFGGINIDQAYSVKQTRDSGLVIAGFTNSFGYGGYDMYVIKTDKLGDTLWTKTYGGSNWDFAYSIDTTNDGGYIISGGTYSFGKGDEDMYLVKINSIGDTLWTKTYGGLNQDEAKSVIQISDGGYILTGFSKSFGDTLSDIYTIKTNPTGDTIWTYKYNGSQADFSNQVIESINGDFLIAGKRDTSHVGNFDMLIVDLSSAGQEIANYTYGGNENDGANSIAESPSGNVALAGYTYSYGHGLGTDDIISYFFSNLSLTYATHASTFGGTKDEVANCISRTTDNGYIICGNSNSYSNLDHIYLIKTDSNGVSSGSIINIETGINSISEPNKYFSIYPNPANNNASINFLSVNNNENKSIVITDIMGKESFHHSYSTLNNKIELNTSSFTNGIYFIHLQNGNESSVGKIIIQH